MSSTSHERTGHERAQRERKQRADPEPISSGGGRTAGTDDRDPQRARGMGAVGVALALVGGLAVGSGPALSVMRTAEGEALGAVGAAGLTAAVLACAVPFLAGIALVVRRVAFAGALLAAAGVLSAGLCVLDAALWTDAINANRLELYRPVTAAALEAQPATFIVLIGHGLGMVAGLVGLMTLRRASLADGYGHSDYPEATGRSAGARAGFLLVVPVGVAAAVLVAALFAPPLRSTDPVILVPAVIESGFASSVGAALVAVGVLVVVTTALASISPLAAAGALVGGGLAALGLVGTRLVAGIAAGDRIGPGAGSVWGASAAAVLVLAGAGMPVIVAARERRALQALVTTAPDETGPGKTGPVRTHSRRWHAAAGVAGIGTGVLAGVGALLPILQTPAPLPAPQIYATRVVLVAAIVLAVASVWLLLSEFAAAVRPAVGVLWVAVVMAASGVLQPMVLALDIRGIELGAGAVAIALAVVGAVLTGLLTWLAGSAERDEIDTSAELPVNRTVLVVGGVGALTAVIGLALPLYRGEAYTATSVGKFPWGWDAWGQALFAAAVVIAVAVASRSRPVRAGALLAGVAVGMSVYLMGWPLTQARVEDPVAGPGAAPAIVGMVLLGIAAVLTVRPKIR